MQQKTNSTSINRTVIATAPIICLCGNMSSQTVTAKLQEAERKFTLQGMIVLTPLPVTEEDNEHMRGVFHIAHKRKIDLAHSVYVVNPEGITDDNVHLEVLYAMSKSKPVKFLEDTPVPQPEEL